MTRREAENLLYRASIVMDKMGLGHAAGVAEDMAMRLGVRLEVEHIRGWADHILPRGKRGRIVLVLSTPPTARALAFIAAVLRSIT